MSKTSDLNQQSDFSTAANSDLLQAVELKIEKQEGRQRRVFAKIQIPYPLEQVWQILTDYEAWAEFMPGITQSRRLEHPTGGIYLEQIRLKTFMGMKVSSRSIFEVEEKFPNEIHYQLVEGDLKAFSGIWRLEAWKSSDQQVGVDLIYNISVLPKPIFPAALVEHVMSQDVPASLLAIRQRVEKRFG